MPVDVATVIAVAQAILAILERVPLPGQKRPRLVEDKVESLDELVRELQELAEQGRLQAQQQDEEQRLLEARRLAQVEALNAQVTSTRSALEQTQARLRVALVLCGCSAGLSVIALAIAVYR
jgi:multidrug efflux pump subunit AcrA (membrane-fusion protein)